MSSPHTVPEADEDQAARLRSEYPTWRIWVSQGSDGGRGGVYATRRNQTLSDEELNAGLAMTVSAESYADLAGALARQQFIEDGRRR